MQQSMCSTECMTWDLLRLTLQGPACKRCDCGRLWYGRWEINEALCKRRLRPLGSPSHESHLCPLRLSCFRKPWIEEPTALRWVTFIACTSDCAAVPSSNNKLKCFIADTIWHRTSRVMLTAQVKDAALKAEREVERGAAAAAHGATTAASSAAHAAQGAAHVVQEAAHSAGHRAQEGIKGAAQGVQSAVHSAVDRTQEGVKGAAHGTQELLSGAAHAAAAAEARLQDAGTGAAHAAWRICSGTHRLG